MAEVVEDMPTSNKEGSFSDSAAPAVDGGVDH